jgi:hypothetical protein
MIFQYHESFRPGLLVFFKFLYNDHDRGIEFHKRYLVMHEADPEFVN